MSSLQTKRLTDFVGATLQVSSCITMHFEMSVCEDNRCYNSEMRALPDILYSTEAC